MKLKTHVNAGGGVLKPGVHVNRCETMLRQGTQPDRR